MRNTSEAQFFHSAVSGSALYTWAILTSLLLVTSSLVNSWNLLAVLGQLCRQLWPCGIIHVHLFFIDLLSSSIFYTINVINITFPYLTIWNHWVFCQTASFLTTYVAICSSMSICKIAIFRVYSAYHRRLPVKILQTKVERLLIGLTCGAHILSALAAGLPFMVDKDNGEVSPPYGFCGKYPYSFEHMYAQQVVKMVAWSFVPTSATTVCYYIIHRQLREETSVRFDEYQLRVEDRRQLHSTASVIALDQCQLRAVRRMRVLSYRLIIRIVLKFVVHYPISFYYLLRDDENPKPITNLIVLTLHFSSTLLNAVMYGLTDPQMKQSHQRLAKRIFPSWM